MGVTEPLMAWSMMAARPAPSMAMVKPSDEEDELPFAQFPAGVGGCGRAHTGRLLITA